MPGCRGPWQDYTRRWWAFFNGQTHGRNAIWDKGRVWAGCTNVRPTCAVPEIRHFNISVRLSRDRTLETAMQFPVASITTSSVFRSCLLRRENRFHRVRLTVGERILRELQRPLPGWITQWRGLHHIARGSNPDRTLASPLQYGQAAQRLRLPPGSAQEHRPDRPKTDHALTFKLDHPMGALQSDRNQR